MVRPPVPGWSTLTAKAASANHGLRSHVAVAVLNQESSGPYILVKIGQRIAAVGTETDENDAIGPNVRPDTSQDRTFSSGSDKGHHVAGEDGRVEEFAVACSGQVELGEVSYEPGGTPDHAAAINSGSTSMPTTMCPRAVATSADPSRAATGVEDLLPGSDHRVQQTSLTTRLGHRPLSSGTGRYTTVNARGLYG